MLVGSLVSGAVSKDTSLAEGATLLWGHPHVREELLDLLEVLASSDRARSSSAFDARDVPLEVHARYTRVEILAAFDVGKVPRWRRGRLVFTGRQCPG